MCSFANFSAKIKANRNKFGLFLKEKNRFIRCRRNFVKWRSPFDATHKWRSPFHKISTATYKAIFFLQEKSKFIAICFNFGREICKRTYQINLVRRILQVFIFGYLPGIYLTNVDYARQSSAKQFVTTRLTPEKGLKQKFWFLTNFRGILSF